jgi:hypothetical protein
MSRKLSVIVVLCAILLVALTLVLTSRYREPRGVATGGVGGCGGDPVAEVPADAFPEDGFLESHDAVEAP